MAAVPSIELCMGCHRNVGGELPAIARLRVYATSDRPVPWVRVNRLPDFVRFSHRAHLRTGMECSRCHGPVSSMARVYQHASLEMGWCLDCHRSRPRPEDSSTTRGSGEIASPPEIPPGRQSRGLYPRRIRQSYGDTRAPVDCATCHQ